MRDPRQSQHQGLAALLDSPDAAPRAAPYALRRELLASKANALSQREPSLAHLAASNLADQSVNHAVAAARQQSQSHSAENKAETRADEAFNVQRDVVAAVSKSEQFTGFTPSSAGALSHMASPFSQHALDPTDAFAHLPAGLRIQLQAPGGEDMSRASSLVYHQQVGRLPKLLHDIVISAMSIAHSSSPIQMFYKPEGHVNLAVEVFHGLLV